MLRVASLFAGCGGSSLGYKQAGLDVVYANEFNDDAADCYEANSDIGVDRRDVLEVPAADIPSIDVLDASPPCQGISMGGRRAPNDPRNKLYFVPARLAAEIRPRAICIENVRGLQSSPMRELLFEPALRMLRGNGYSVATRELDASWLGVPQIRRRVIVIGLRDDLDLDPREALPRRGQRQQAAIHDVIPGAVRLLSYEDSWAATGPAPTITTGGIGWPQAIPSVELGDGTVRRVTATEAALLCGFPEDFILPFGNAAAWHVLGNAVAPAMARSWAERLAAMLG